jgi:2-methylisocitrate lyase-like PEP mutase family enzyme
MSEAMAGMILKKRLEAGDGLLVPGIYDALSAHLAVTAGFNALYVSGAALAYTKLGRSDVGLVSMSEAAEHVALIRDRVDAALIVDADTGYGNALNVQRTVRMFERAGANAIQLEDQTFPKRCGHLQDKRVIPVNEMVGKIRAAADARRSGDTLIIGRSDALAIEGFQAAVDRAAAYAEAGADALFVEAPRSLEQLTAIAKALSGVRPLLANMVEGGQTPLATSAELHALGFQLVIFPGAVVRAVTRTLQEFYDSVMTHGGTAAFQNRMLDFDGLNEAIGTPELLATGRRYEGA